MEHWVEHWPDGATRFPQSERRLDGLWLIIRADWKRRKTRIIARYQLSEPGEYGVVLAEVSGRKLSVSEYVARVTATQQRVIGWALELDARDLERRAEASAVEEIASLEV